MSLVSGFLSRLRGTERQDTDGARRLPRAWGNIDVFEHTPSGTNLQGWVFHSLADAERVVARCNGIFLGESVLFERPDVAAVYPASSRSLRSGFAIFGPAVEGKDGLFRISIEGWRGQQPVLEYRWNAWESAARPDLPPPHLMQRVAGTPDVECFERVGLISALDFADAIEAHREAREVGALLDWGCGCGRMMLHLLNLFPAAAISGCDIDGEAVEWCRKHIHRGTFEKIEPFPPTMFSDGAFDVVVGCSVMTHLSKADQLRWLAEIRRITKPGGLFITSVHGPYAASFVPEVVKPLKRTGFFDKLDPALDGVAPDGYYRSTFQTAAFTRSLWGGQFRILEHISGGLAGYQDLVTMRRPE